MLLGPPWFNWWISFAPVFSGMYCLVLIFILSPFYILIYMYKEIPLGSFVCLSLSHMVFGVRCGTYS